MFIESMNIVTIGTVKFTEEQAADIFVSIRSAVLRSFRDDALRGCNGGKGHGIQNQTEIMRRWKICEQHVVIMRKESGFAYQRICDRIYDVLRSVLDGNDPEIITKSNLWAPS